MTRTPCAVTAPVIVPIVVVTGRSETEPSKLRLLLAPDAALPRRAPLANGRLDLPLRVNDDGGTCVELNHSDQTVLPLMKALTQ